MKNSKHLILKIFFYLIIFSLLILFFLWLLQILLLNNYYEYYKTNELNLTINTLKNNYKKDNFESVLEDVAFNTDFCVEITSLDGSYYSNIQNNKGCIDTVGNQKLFQEKQSFMQSNEDSFKLKIVNPRFNNKTLLYGTKLDDNQYLFVNTSLEPIDTTIDVLKNQFIIVSIIVIILGAIAAYFISRSLSKPITKLTKSAKELSNGNYNIKFDVESDILEIKELGNTLDYAKNEMKKTDETRREILSNVSHDLKTPLTMIKAYAEMERDLDISKEKHDNNMNIIIEEVDRLNILVNDILNLSKLESNMDTLNIEKLNLTDLINAILNRFKIFSYTKNYEFIFDYDKPLYIEADKQKLEQVIYNLIGNAINYTGKDQKVYINIIENKKNIRVEIKDTGKGIKKEDINKVWDKYYKTDKKYKRNTIGTGIGLSIVKNIFILHHFKYGIDSIENKGSTFWFEIPITKTKK